MEGIEFDEEKGISNLSTQNSPVAEEKKSLFYNLLKRFGVDDRNTANFILLGVAVIFFGIAFFIYARVLDDNAHTKLTGERIKANLQIKRARENLK